MDTHHKRGFGPLGVIFYAFFTFAAITCAGTYSGGSGTAEDPYQISTKANWQELIATASDWNKQFILINDINFGGATINPVAPDNDPTEWNGFQGMAFTGVILGDGYALQNAVVNRPGIDYVGLIGQVGAGGQVIDLRMEAITVTGRHFVGVLTGEINGGFVQACRSSGTVTGVEYIGGLIGLVSSGRMQSSSSTCSVNATEHFLGGLVGVVESSGVIDSCNTAGVVKGKSNTGGLIGSNGGIVLSSYTKGSVDGASGVGGLVGNSGGWIYNCTATGPVTGSVQSIGGLAGSNEGAILASRARGAVSGRWQFVGGLVGSNTGTITASFATGAVSGGPIRGGLVGDFPFGLIWGCYSTGLVSGTVSNLGGLIGQNAGGKTLASFWDKGTSGITTSAGGTGKSTIEMHNLQTYLGVGWDFVGESANGIHDLWQLPAGDYPQHSEVDWTLEGSGITDDPYQIKTVSDLGKIWLRPEGCFQLEGDLDLTGIRWSMPVVPVFRGIFDGQNHRINRMEIVLPDVGEIGMFGHVLSGGILRNVRLDQASIHGWYSVGALAGMIESGIIEGCSSSGEVNGVETNTGGLVGLQRQTTMTDCHSSCTMSGGGDEVGGLVGYNHQGALSFCSASGSVIGSQDSVGGLAGHNSGTMTRCFSTGKVEGVLKVGGLAGYGGGILTACHAAGAVVGDRDIGGLVGYIHGGSISDSFALGDAEGTAYVGGLVGRKESCPVKNCYARGKVDAVQQYVGGLLGENRGGNVSNCYSTGAVCGVGIYVGGLVGKTTVGNNSSCYWDKETSGLSTSSGGTGKTMGEMMTKSTFTAAGWDFENTWAICEGTNYPRLKWQIPSTDWVCPDGVSLEDLVYFAGRWMAGTPATVGAADGNGDGRVDMVDLAIVSANWMRE